MRPQWSVDISTNIPGIILVIWATTRLFFRWFGEYDYYFFGMVLDLVAIYVLLVLSEGAAHILKGKIVKQRDEL